MTGNQGSTSDRTPLSDQAIVERLDEQRRRHARLQERQRLARLELEQRLRDLEAVRAEARDAFGTDDPEALKALLAEHRQRNAEAVRAFEEQLDAIEQALSEIEDRTHSY